MTGNGKINPSKSRVVIFATQNINKFNEARIVFAKHGLAAAMLKLETVEIQSDNLETIAKKRAADAIQKYGLPIIVEDAGLSVQALNGFPGPYAAYVYKTIGNQGLLKLMENVDIRNAYFESVVAFHAPNQKEPLCFHGRVEGEITRETRGVGGFGFDPVFMPLKSNGKVFAEMSLEEKNLLSHRARALAKFAEWYKRVSH